MAARPSSRKIRSLAEDLRTRSDDTLITLLQQRPDLARPAIPDLRTLAARATATPSAARALDNLAPRELHVLQALAISNGNVTHAATLLNITPTALRRSAETLRDLALLWKEKTTYHVPAGVNTALGPYIAGLAPADENTPHPDEIADRLTTLTPHQRTILDTLTWGPPIGDIPPTGRITDIVEHLTTLGLLQRPTPTRIILPRTVALALRNGNLLPPNTLDPTPPTTTPLPPHTHEATLAAITTCLERIDELGHILATTPPRMLRNGSLGVRDLRRIAAELDTDTNTTTLYLEIAYSAGLIGTFDPPARHADTDTYYAPTLTYDAWRHTSAATRWARLALAWFDTDRTTTATTPLGPENTSTAYRTTRHSVLHALATLPTGHGTTPASLATSLTTQHPRRDPALLTDATHATVHEGTHLGIITNGALTPTGHALWDAWNNGLTTTDLIDPDTPPSTDGDPHSTALHALATLDTHLPPPAKDILLQSDLTAVVPGRLEGHTADLLHLIADLESRGGASVFRFTPESIRRYLDTAASADDLLNTLKRHCPTGIPQPLEYLIRDVARRHGRVRVGETSTYLTSDDTACLDAIEHDPRLTHLALRRLAPTVSITHYDRNTTLTALRKAGHSPLAESLSGNRTPHSLNATRATDQHTPTPFITAPPPISHDDAAHLVQAMRAGDAALTNNNDTTIEASDPTITLDTLREAITARHNVWISLAGPDGSTTKLLLRPTFIEAGRIHGIVEGTDAVRTFSIHRLIGATPAPPTPKQR